MFPVAKRIIAVHPLAQKLNTLREIERRMILGVAFPFLYAEVSDAIARIEPLVDGTPLRAAAQLGVSMKD